MSNFTNTPIRFFIYDESIVNEYDDTQGNFREATETEFLEAEGNLEYKRFTIRENGCEQITLTKNPFHNC